MEQNNQSKSTVHVVTAVKEGYEYAVGQEALKRVGNLPADKLKGVVHEVMYKDRFNLKNLLSGKRAEFSTSTQAVRDDLLIKEGGNVVGRMQLKDAPKSISSVVRRVKQGDYRATTLVGTEETVEAYTKVAPNQGVTKTMHSSGISSSTTERVAAKARGSMPSKNVLLDGAKQAGKAGALVSGGIAAATAAVQYLNGDIDEKEAVVKVVSAGAAGYAGGAAGAVVSSVTAAAVSSTLAAATATGIGSAVAGSVVGGAVIAAAPVVVPIVAAVAVGGAVSSAVGSLVSWLFD